MCHATGGDVKNRVLVTGGAGFIGSHLCDALLREGWSVHVLDDLSTGRRAHLASACTLHVGSILDEGALARALDGVEVVCHLAARVTIRGSVDGFCDDAMVNHVGTLRVLGAAARAGVRRVVMASSMAVYAEGPAAGGRVHEAHATEPRSPYGVSKLAAERTAFMVAPRLGVEAVVLRYFNTFGTRQAESPYVGVITRFAAQMRRGESITLYGDGEQVRDFVHVSDVVEATRLALTVPAAAGRAFNVGTGVGTTVNAVAAMLRTRLGIVHDGWCHHAPARPEELLRSVADITEAQRVLGYAPRTELASRLDEVLV
jgi:UDP-glucose 4-epimerase